MENKENSEEIKFDLKWTDQGNPEISLKISKNQNSELGASNNDPGPRFDSCNQVYTVVEGDLFLENIARKLNVPVEDLGKCNFSESVTVGQKVYYAKVGAGCNWSWRIQQGDTKDSIAQMWNLGVNEFEQCNPDFNWNNMQVGDSVFFKYNSRPFQSCRARYAVVPGDTLDSVSEKLFTPVKSFLKCNDANQIDLNHLEQYQVLYYQMVGRGCTLSYQVQPGQTIDLIKVILGITDSVFMQCNPYYQESWSKLEVNDWIFYPAVGSNLECNMDQKFRS